MTQQQKHESLLRNVRILCTVLNQNNILRVDRIFHSMDNIEYPESKWEVYKDDPGLTFGGLIRNKYNRKAFDFLKKNGYLDIGVCWHCGETPIKNEYNFSFGQNLDYFICNSCYTQGRSFQKSVLGYNKPEKDSNKNCYIATVCYGDINSSKVEEFRNFRDAVLNKSSIGLWLIKVYYRISPSVANYLRTKARCNFIVRVFLLDTLLKIIRKFSH